MNFILKGLDLNYLSGLIWFLYMFCNLALYILPVLLFALIKFLVPSSSVRRLSYQAMETLYGAAVAGNVILFERILGIQIEARGLEHLKLDKDAVVLVNHQSWMDIPMVQNLLHRRAPIPKFIAKWEVLYIPLVGLICWAFEFPLVRRYSRKYLEKHPEKAGRDLWMLHRHFSRPDLSRSSIIIYADGTRYTPEKAAEQKTPFINLLRPKAGGLNNVIQALGSKIDVLLDLTIVYDSASPIFWNLLSGRCRKVVVDVRKIYLNDWFEKDAEGNFIIRQDLTTKRLNELWQEKDHCIEQVKAGFISKKTIADPEESEQAAELEQPHPGCDDRVSETGDSSKLI